LIASTICKIAPKEAKRGNGCKPLKNRETLRMLKEILACRKLSGLNERRLGEVSNDADAKRSLFIGPRGLSVLEEYHIGGTRIILVEASSRIVHRHRLTLQILEKLKGEIDSLSLPKKHS